MASLISGIMGGCAVVLWQAYAVPKIDLQIEEAMIHASKHKKGSLSANVAKGLRIERENVDEVLIYTVKAVKSISDSLRRFTKDFFPAIQRSHNYINVGLKIDRKTGVVYYLANDSVMYQAIPSSEGIYFYYPTNNQGKECQ